MGTPTPGDEEILARYLDVGAAPPEREAAFHTLVDRYHRRVFAVCLQALGSVGDAEDATQETFLKLARNADSFRGEAQLSTWLYRVARNASIDLIRRDARRPTTPVADPGLLDQAPAEPDTTDTTHTRMAVTAALQQLDPISRQALVLVAVEGLSYAEAGAALDLPVGTVKSRVSRARGRLAVLMSDTEDTDDPSPDDATPTGGDASHP